MKIILLITIYLFSTLTMAGDSDVAVLLKRDLGEQIDFVSESEIRYCPDNTCSIYKASKRQELLPTYVYLHIIHASDYTLIYRSPFIQTAKESTAILNNAMAYCSGSDKSAQCVLNGLSNTIDVKEYFGRYDEGSFCYSCSEKEKLCHKL